MWLPHYDRRFLRFDLIAGATVWGLLVPESIGYAGLAGLLPQAGLYTLLVTLAANAVLGTSRHLIAAATSAAAVLLASSISGLSSPDASHYASDAAALVLFCGGLFVVAGLLRLGFVAQFLSRPVMEGSSSDWRKEFRRSDILRAVSCCSFSIEGWAVDREGFAPG